MPFNERFTGTVVINDTATNDFQTWSSQKISTTGGGSGGFLYRGAYSGTTLYAVNNVVSYLGSSWIRTALNGTAVGDAPAVGSAYWGVFASAGAQGEPGLSTSLFEYRIDRNAIVLAGLAAGDIRANNADLTAATLLWVSHVDDLGNDVERFIALLKSGSQLIIQDKSNNDNFIIYNVLSGVSQVANSHITIPVASSSGNGLANLVNNHPVFLALQFTTNPTLVISPTITGAPGTSAEVVNIGTGSNANLVFTIPQGLTGATGPQGPAGASGTSADLEMTFSQASYYGTTPSFDLFNMATGGVSHAGGSLTIGTRTGTTQIGKSYHVRSNVSSTTNGAVSGWHSTGTGPTVYVGGGFKYTYSFGITDTSTNAATRTMIGLTQSASINTLNSTATVASITTQFIGIIQEVGESTFSFYSRGSGGNTKIDSLIPCTTPTTSWYTLTLHNQPSSDNVTVSLTQHTLGSSVNTATWLATCGTTNTMSTNSASYVLMQRNMASASGTTGSSTLALGGIKMYYR